MDFDALNITSYLSLNETSPEPYRRTFLENVFGSAFTVFLAVISISGNLAVVFASYWDETLREQQSNLLLVYLSLTDIMTGFLIMFPGAISIARDSWPFGDILCRFHAGLSYMFSCSSSFNIAFISVDRALAVVKPLQYATIVTTKRIVIMCIFLFVMGTSLMLPTVGFGWTHYDYFEGVCALDWKIPQVHFIATWGCISCHYVPAVTMGFCNSLIILTALKSKTQKLFVRRKDVAVSKKTAKDSNMNKTITSMIVVVLTYYTTHSPYALSKHLKASLGVTVPIWFNFLITILIYISSATNPFIYGILRKDYRNAYKKLPRILSQKIFG